jgi:putative flippase GtrA
MISAQFKKELLRFLISGITAVSVDCLSYSSLLYIGTAPAIAKGIGFLFGTLVTYFLNKFWTFQKPHREWQEVLRFVSVYALSMGINIGINHIFLEKTGIVILAFLCATAVSTVFNFICLKLFVFKK